MTDSIKSEDCFAPNHPLKPELGKRTIATQQRVMDRARRLYGSAQQRLFQAVPDGMVRLRYGYVVKCTGFEKDAAGNVTTVHCEYLPDTKSGTPGSDAM